MKFRLRKFYRQGRISSIQFAWEARGHVHLKTLEATEGIVIFWKQFWTQAMGNMKICYHGQVVTLTLSVLISKR